MFFFRLKHLKPFPPETGRGFVSLLFAVPFRVIEFFRAPYRPRPVSPKRNPTWRVRQSNPMTSIVAFFARPIELNGEFSTGIHALQVRTVRAGHFTRDASKTFDRPDVRTAVRSDRSETGCLVSFVRSGC